MRTILTLTWIWQYDLQYIYNPEIWLYMMMHSRKPIVTDNFWNEKHWRETEGKTVIPASKELPLDELFIWIHRTATNVITFHKSTRPTTTEEAAIFVCLINLIFKICNKRFLGELAGKSRKKLLSCLRDNINQKEAILPCVYWNGNGGW